MSTVMRYFILAALTLAGVLAAFLFGSHTVGPAEIAGLFRGGPDTVTADILLKIRMPRIAMALLLGGSLAVSGTVFQALLRNPLADPYIIGVSGGAALGATFAIMLSLPQLFVMLAAFAGSLAAVTAVYVISRRILYGTTSLILAGVAMGFILSSAVLLAFALARSTQVHRAVMWLMGDLSIARYEWLVPAGIVALAVIAVIMLHHRHLDVISFGHRFSRNLGVTPGNLRALFWAASLLSALMVSLAGVIGFVGLIVPHVARSVFGARHLRLIPAAALGGGLFLLLSDTVARSVASPFEIPVGVMTGLFGGIFFLVFMTRRDAKKQ